jgi:YidC/Oxa1 family membrane protein insertase
MELLFTLFYQPLYNVLFGLYNIFGDFGIAIIVMTLVLKAALIPLSRKQIESQKEMAELQPKIKELQKKYKNDKEKLSKETMALYKEHNVNPAAGCLPLIIQLIVFITMYRVISNLAVGGALDVHNEYLYGFITAPTSLDENFLGFLNLTIPSVPLAVITAIAQFIQLKMMQLKNSKKEDKTKEVANTKEASKDKTPDFASIMQKQMLFIVPIMTLFIGIKFPSGLALYWLTSTLFMIAQQWYIMHKENKEIETTPETTSSK